MRSLPMCVAMVMALGFSRADALVIKTATQPDFAMHQWRTVEYDRNANRPSEVGGNAGDMSSVTKTDWDISFSYGFKYSTDYPCSGTTHCCRDGHHHCGPSRTTLEITSFKINGRQSTTVYIPKDAPQLLRDHEQAHFEINVYTYDQAFYRSRDFSRRMLRRTFTADTLDAAKSQVDAVFNRDYRDPYARWRDDLHNALNKLDGNGRGDGVAPKQVVRQVIANNP